MPASQSTILPPFWPWVSNLGIDDRTPVHRAPHIRVSNRISVVLSLLTVPFVFYFNFLVNSSLPLLVVSSFLGLTLLSLFFNRLRWYFLGKIAPLVLLELTIFFLASILGPSAGFQWLFAPIIFGGVLYFGAREKWSMWLVAGCAILLYSILEISDYGLFHERNYPEDYTRFLSRAVMFTSCLISVAIAWLSRDIARRRHQSLIKAKETITAVFEHSSDAIFLVDEEQFLISECNKRALMLLEIDDKQSLIGRSLLEFCMVTPSRKLMRGILEHVHKGGWEGKTEYRGVKGNVFWGGTAINDLHLTDDRSLMVRMTDITELQESRFALKRQGVQLNEAQRLARMGNSLIDTKNSKIYWSETLYEIFGLPDGFEITLDSFREMVHPDDREKTLADLSEALRERKPFDLEYRVHRYNDKGLVYIHSAGKSLYSEGENSHLMVGCLQDVTTQKVAEEALKGSLDLFALAVQATNDGIWDWDMLADKVYFSPRWKEMIGYADDELPNEIQTWEKVLFDEDRERALQLMDDYNSGKSDSFEAILRCHRKDGTIAHILSRATHLKDDSGTVVRMIGAHTDITPQIVHEEELKKAKDAAELANRFKSTFLANMSHEIRTPINGILGFTDLLLKTTPSEEQREYLQYIYGSGDTLLQLLNDILDLNKIEQGKLDVETIHFAFRNMFSKAMLPYQYIAGEKGIEFNFALGEGVPEFIVGDPIRIRQILINLVNNAIKFTLSGKIEVLVDAVQQGNNQLKLVGTVTDSGSGIPKDRQAQIFDSFTQADSSITRKYGGSGLGLSIVSQLVSLMDGAIDVESPVPEFSGDPNTGTCFRFSILVEQGERSDIEDDQRQMCKNVRFNRSWKVLVAEDNKVNQLLAKKVLTQLGAEVDVANNGEESLNMVKEGTFDAVIMDLQMPVMDGYEATRQILSLHPDLPVIALSANVYREDIERCYEAGMVDHIAKPFSEKSIFTTLNRWLS